MKATINNDWVVTLNDDVRISQVTKERTIFRAKKGVCDWELLTAAASGTIEQLNESLGEWQILVKSELIKWEA